MVILSSLYKLLIGPLELFFEVLFAVAYRIIGDPALSIIFLSLAMNFLVLPLYRRADAMQEEERDRAARMQPWVSHIKKTFKGDERFMMLQTYYRQCNYKQTDVFKGSVSLLLEIPFFIAAFHFLSNLALLRGVSFGPIADLGAPDALIQVAGVSINFLPILMTAINAVSAFVYMKGFPLKSKVQMYGIAVIFLVLLYNSPAGLVFYWTLNNLFSLVKNLFYKMKDPKRVLCILASITGLALLVAVLFVHPLPTLKRQVFVIACGLLLQVPLAMRLLPVRDRRFTIHETTKDEERTFLFGCIFMALLVGLLIPISVLQASPAEFVDVSAYSSPLRYLREPFLLATGTFVIWLGVFYRLATPKGKSVFGYVLLVAVVAALVDYLFFGANYGNLSPMLQFDTVPKPSRGDMLKNLAVLLAVAAALFVLWRKKANLVRVGYLCMCFAVMVMTVFGAVDVTKQLEPVRNGVDLINENEPNYTLSKNGHNVVVIMMDRAVPYYLPYILNERPDLQESFSGFTFYPNTVSYGAFTNVGTPGLYGGYDYTPEASNARSDLSLEEKQNEALKVMPKLFSENGFEVTVFDPTYAGYGWIPDLTVFDDVPGVKTYITMNGRYRVKALMGADADKKSDAMRSRNFFCYSLFKISPLVMQPSLYNKGDYNSAATLGLSEEMYILGGGEAQYRTNESQAIGVSKSFAKSYGVLENLPKITHISEGSENTFLMMSNDTTHEPLLLQEPEYTPALAVDNVAYDREHPTREDWDGNVLDLGGDTQDRAITNHIYYETNMTAMIELAKWLDYLKANDVYDNTRIIIVSDHSHNLNYEEDLIKTVDDPEIGAKTNLDPMIFNCMFLVKDFDSSEFTVDDTFMTNADTPTIAMDGLVENPVNPFTGNAIDSSAKAGEQHLLWCTKWDTDENNGNQFLPGFWFSVHDDIFESGNWEYLGYY